MVSLFDVKKYPKMTKIRCRFLTKTNTKTNRKQLNMYLKFVRNIQPCGEVRRGTLYSVHFQPNEMGDYNEQLTIISEAYEIPYGHGFPLPLIYPAGLVCIHGNLRLTLGDGERRSALLLIDSNARTTFIPELQELIKKRIDTRIEVCEE